MPILSALGEPLSVTAPYWTPFNLPPLPPLLLLKLLEAMAKGYAWRVDAAWPACDCVVQCVFGGVGCGGQRP
jgi:hypothetical protein